jgi:hypothetical protein
MELRTSYANQHHGENLYRFGDCRQRQFSSRRIGLGCAAMVRPASPIMPRRRGVPKPDRHRALELLAASPDGCTEAIMLAHGFTVELLVDLCIAELAIATPERMVAGGRTVEVVRMKITEAGRRALT